MREVATRAMYHSGVRTQAAAKVEPAPQPLPEVDARTALAAQVAELRIEACSHPSSPVVACSRHGFMSAVHAAFTDHRGFAMSPDMLWLLVVQGAAGFLNQQGHAGPKEKIVVRRDDFVKGSPDNPWPEIFPLFTDMIRKVAGPEIHDAFVTRFSTTGPVELAAQQIVLMDAMKSRFDYLLQTLCGIPFVTLEGDPADWARLRDRAGVLGRTLRITDWTDRLAPTLDRIAANAAGRDDADLWNGMYKWKSKSGGDMITGWLVDFFPFLVGHEGTIPNPWKQEIQDWNLPSGLSRAPVLWQYLTEEIPLQFVSGFAGFTQDATSFAVRPRIGWAVAQEAARGHAGIAYRPNRMIWMVVPGSGALQAGLRTRDVLVDLPDTTQWVHGQVVTITVERDGKPLAVEVTLGSGEWRSLFKDGAL